MGFVATVWHSFSAGVEWMARVFAYLGAAAILLSILVILRESVGRYLFNEPTAYAYPLVSMLVLVILYFSLGYTASVSGHVSSDIVYGRLPPRGKAVVLLASEITGAWLGFLLAREGWGQIQRSLLADARIHELGGLPTVVPESFILLGSSMLLLVSLTRMPRHVTALVTGRHDLLRADEQVQPETISGRAAID